MPHNDPSKDIIGGAKYNEIKLYANNLVEYKPENHNIKFLLEINYIRPYDYYYLNYIPAFNNKKS